MCGCEYTQTNPGVDQTTGPRPVRFPSSFERLSSLALSMGRFDLETQLSVEKQGIDLAVQILSEGTLNKAALPCLTIY